MQILVTGHSRYHDHIVELLSEQGHEVMSTQTGEFVVGETEADILIDTTFDDDPTETGLSEDLPYKLLILSAAKTSLAEAAHTFPILSGKHIAGVNMLPTFFERDVLEFSTLFPETVSMVNQFAEVLQKAPKHVQDRVGMVTPRVVCMIINEACYTVQEGTANYADIDQGMRLGTNYPKGPFEWANAIGIHHVYELLEAVQEDTKAERYNICPLLKRHYLRQQEFQIQ